MKLYRLALMLYCMFMIVSNSLSQNIPPLSISSSQLPVSTQGRLTSAGELVEGCGIKVTLTGPTGPIYVGRTYDLALRIEPGDSWTTETNYFGTPTSVQGLGTSQILAYVEGEGVEVGTPRIAVDGTPVAEEITMGVVSSLFFGIPTSLNDVIVDAVNEIIDYVVIHRLFLDTAPTTTVEISSPAGYAQGSPVRQVRWILGDPQNALLQLASANSVEMILPVTFTAPGSHSIVFHPDIRGEVYVVPDGAPIPTNPFYTGFECRRQISVEFQTAQPRIELTELTVNGMPFNVALGQLPEYLRFGENIRVKGRLIDAHGMPIANSAVGVEDGLKLFSSAIQSDAEGRFEYDSRVSESGTHGPRNILFFMNDAPVHALLNFRIEVPLEQNIYTNQSLQALLPGLTSKYGSQFTGLETVNAMGVPYWYGREYVTSLFTITSVADVDESNYMYVLQHARGYQTDPFFLDPEIRTRAEQLAFQSDVGDYFQRVLDNAIADTGPAKGILYIGSGAFCVSGMFGFLPGVSGCALLFKMAALDLIRSAVITAMQQGGANELEIDGVRDARKATTLMASDWGAVGSWMSGGALLLDETIFRDQSITQYFDALQAGSQGGSPYDDVTYEKIGNVVRLRFSFHSTRYDLQFIIEEEGGTLYAGTVAPALGTSADDFVFEVWYKSPEPPGDVHLNIDGVSELMVPSGDDWSQGVKFTLTKYGLPLGQHQFYFTATVGTSTLRFPTEPQVLSVTVNPSSEGWDIALDPEDCSLSSSSVSPGGNVRVYAEVSSLSAAGNVYTDVEVKAELRDPTGIVKDTDSQVLSPINPLETHVVPTMYLSCPSDAQNGLWTVTITVLVSQDSRWDNNTASLPLYVGPPTSNEQYVTPIASSYLSVGDALTINKPSGGSLTYTVTGIRYAGGSDDYVTFRSPSGSTASVYEDRIRIYGSDGTAIALHAVHNIGVGQGEVSGAASVSGTGPAFFEKELIAYLGSTATFTARAPSGLGFASKSDHKVFTLANGENLVKPWYSSLSRSDDTACFTFTIPTTAAPGDYPFYLLTPYTTGDIAHLTRLTLHVCQPLPQITALSRMSLSADDTLTITGTNFGAGGSVKFNGLDGQQVSWSNTLIKCIVPVGVTNGNVFVSTGAGVSNGMPYQVVSSTGIPQVVMGIPDQEMDAATTMYVADLKNVFWDPNGETLLFGATSSLQECSILSDSLVSGRLYVTASSLAQGVASIIVTATDTRIKSARDTFALTINNNLPPLPGGTALVSPAHLSQDQPLTVLLKWNAASMATSYQAQVATDTLSPALVVNDSALVDTMRLVANLEPVRTYFWRVRGRNITGRGPFTGWWSFRTVESGPPLFSVNPQTLGLGETMAGMSLCDSITVTNNGTSTLLIASVSATDTCFTVTPTTVSVPPRGSTMFTIRFGAPTSVEPPYPVEFSATIVFAHNASGSFDTVAVNAFVVETDIVSDLVAHYTFAGNANDQSGNGHHGTVFGATLTHDRFGEPEEAYGFNGSEYIRVLNEPQLQPQAGSLTVSLWFAADNIDNTQTESYVIDMSDGDGDYSGYMLFVDHAARVLRFYFHYDDAWNHQVVVSSTTTVTIGEWYHVAAVLDRVHSTARLFVNGVSEESLPTTTHAITASNPLMVGRRNIDAPGSDYLHGKVDDMRIYARALNEAEVRRLFQQEPTPGAPTFEVEPAAVSFGVVQAGRIVQDTVVVTNAGTRSLAVTSVASSDVRIAVTPADASIVPGGNKEFIISFVAPFNAGPPYPVNVAGDVVFTHNAMGSPDTVSVSVVIHSADVTDGLIAYYPFSDSAHDESGNAHDGVVYGATPVDDRFGSASSAYSFNGSSNSISVPVFHPLVNSFSFSLWFKKVSFGTAYQVLFGDAGYYQGARVYFSGDSLYFEIQRGSDNNSGSTRVVTIPVSALNANTWHHIAGSSDNGMLTIFLDGALRQTRMDFLGDNGSHGTFTIGRDGFRAVGYLNGIVDDVRIYNRSLSADEVQQLCSGDMRLVACDVVVNAGWNLVSAPIAPLDSLAGISFVGAVSQAFGYGGGYVATSAIRPGAGYWLKFASPTTVTLVGTRVGAATIPVVTGWNMIGAFDVAVGTATVSSIPSDLVTSQFYGFSDTYVPATVLDPGKGYWVRVRENGTLQMQGGTAKVASAVKRVHTEGIRFAVSDAAGYEKVLCLVASGETPLWADLPPRPPVGGFDVRFSSDRDVEVIAARHELLISSVNYPVKLCVSNLGERQLRVKDGVGGRLLDVQIEEGRVLSIAQDLGPIVIEPCVRIPTTYSLSQNYPNPFNPSTVIRFGLPTASHVTLAVYDLLGSKVLTLAEEEFPAGHHDIAVDAARLASGIYFYRIEAGPYHEVRKMVLLK